MAKHGESTPEKRQRGKGRPFEKGNPGRPKGSHDKVTVALIDDVIEAYKQKGGVEWLTSLKDETFARLLERLVPAHSVSEQTVDVRCVFPDEPGRKAAAERVKKAGDLLSEPE